MGAKSTRFGTIIVPNLKPRAKKLNEALVSLGGGPMKSSKDFSRAKEKVSSLKDIQNFMKDIT